MRQRPRASRGYICIWGTSMREKVVDREGVTMTCPECHRESRMIGKRAVPYCAVFYIPLFPEGQGTAFFECASCHTKFQGNLDRLRRQLEQEREQVQDRMEERREHCRKHPDDVEARIELIELHLLAEDQPTALSLAEDLTADFPEEANAQITLARILFLAERKQDALAAFDRALLASPQHPAAHFYKAQVLASDPQADLRGAIEEAKLARKFGYPDARALVEALTSELERPAGR
jgi:tetratricopeptide (TPR) repeat protein